MTVKVRKSHVLPITNNPFHDRETLKKYGKYDGDNSGFVDAEVDNGELK